MINLGFITTTSGATSFGIDALSGKMFRYSTTSYVAELAKQGAKLDRRSALEIAIERFEPIRRSVARSEPEAIEPFCEIWSLNEAACGELKIQALNRREALTQSRDGLELYRALKALQPIKS